jgi:hypothetical protein
MKISSLNKKYLLFLIAMLAYNAVAAQKQTLAFPTAEGFGKYTSGYDNEAMLSRLRVTVPFEYETATHHTVQQAYEAVLQHAGVSYKRDAINQRVVDEVCRGTFTYGDKGNAEKTNTSVLLKSNTIYLRVIVQSGAVCTFSYSLDGKKYRTLGNSFTAKEGKWIGAKVGLFCNRPVANNDSGRVEADWFLME